MSFSSLGLSSALLKAIAEQKHKTPYPIQKEAIPAILSGKDILGIAQTGSGKTAGFVLPVLEQFQKNTRPLKNRHIKALVMVPTRELAVQVAEVLHPQVVDLVEDGEQLDKVRRVRDSLPKLEHVILIEGETDDTISMAELSTRGERRDDASEFVVRPVRNVHVQRDVGGKGCAFQLFHHFGNNTRSRIEVFQAPVTGERYGDRGETEKTPLHGRRYCA